VITRRGEHALMVVLFTLAAFGGYLLGHRDGKRV
jgi:hypothetical protein